jgi:hypothetical protein
MGFYDSVKKINDFVDRYIEEALALSTKELEQKTNHDEGYTFLHAIAGYTRDRQMLRDQLVSVLLAGRDYRLHAHMGDLSPVPGPDNHRQTASRNR